MTIIRTRACSKIRARVFPRSFNYILALHIPERG
uniref:Uncharacterized protein n=1 Tax=Arundo donax TaxID=35708 RepID=A0A0A9AX71_ARUDO